MHSRTALPRLIVRRLCFFKFRALRTSNSHPLTADANARETRQVVQQWENQWSMLWGVAHGFVLWSETGAFEHHLTCLGGCFQSSGLSPVAIAGRVKLMLQGSSAIAQGIAI